MCRTFRKPARAVLYGDERRHPWARMVVGKGCQVANVILEMHGDTLDDSALLFKASKDISAFSAELVWDMEAHVGGVCSQTPPRLHSLEPPTPSAEAADSTADSKKKAEPAVEAQPAVQPAANVDESAAKSPGVQASAVAAEGSATPQAEPTAKAEAAQQSDTRPDPDVIETKEADLSDQQKSKSATASESKATVIPAQTPTAAADKTMDDSQAALVKLPDLDGSLGSVAKNHEMSKTTVYVALNRVFLALQNARKSLPKGVVQCFPGLGTITAANKVHPNAVLYAPVKRTQICVQGKLCTVEDNLSPTVQEVWERQFVKNNFSATPGAHGKANEFYWAPKPHEENDVSPFCACAKLEVVFMFAVREWNGKPALQPIGIAFVLPQKMDSDEARTIWCS